MSRSPGPERGVLDTRPAAAWEDAFLTGNGTHGALVHGRPYDESVVLTHHGLVAPNGTTGVRPPDLGAILERVRDLVLDGRAAEAVALGVGGWPRLAPRPFHPALALRLLHLDPAGDPWDYRRSTDFGTGEVSVEWADATGAWRRDCVASRADDVVLLRLDPPPEWPGGLTVGHEVRLDGAPRGLVVRHFPDAARHDAVLGVRVDYPGTEDTPDPGGYLVATRVVAPEGTCRPTGTGVMVLGGGPVLVIARVQPRHPGEEAADLLSDLRWQLASLPTDHETLLTRHVALHRPVFERVSLDLDASPQERRRPVPELLADQADDQRANPGRVSPALLEKLFDAGRYHLLSSSGSLPPRLIGLWQGDWFAAWSGALTLDANLPLQLAAAVTGDVPPAVHALATLVEHQLDDWRTNARRLFGATGAVAPAHTDGLSGLAYHFEPRYPLHLWTAGADWLLTTLLDHVDATGDEDFLEKRVLPLLAEVAAFYQDFLSRRDAEGDVVVVPSYSPENHPAGAGPDGGAAVDATMDIAAARHALGEALARGVGSADDREAWEDLLERLPPYRINADGALAEWAWPALDDRYDHRHISHLYPAWPLHEISWDRTPRLADAALTALRLRGGEDGSAHGLVHHGLAAARLRDAGGAGQAVTDLLEGRYLYAGLMTSHYPDRVVFNADAACALPGLLLEMLLDSVPAEPGEPAQVELLPAVPGFLRSGRLRGARTRAGVRLVELDWRLPAGTARAVLVSRDERAVRVVCRPATSCRIDHGDGPGDPAAGRGSWLVDLTAGRPVGLDLSWPAARPPPATTRPSR